MFLCSHFGFPIIQIPKFRYVGENDKPIYLSCLGEVYDVTSGHDFYGKGEGYSFFAGRDATISFFTGDFTEAALEKEESILDYSVKEIKSMVEWRKFYEDHETYKFVGVLDGDYYDSEGKATQYLKDIVAKIAEGDEEL